MSTGPGSSAGTGSLGGSSTAAAETSGGSSSAGTAAAETSSGSSAGTSTGRGSSSGVRGDTSASGATTGGALDCDAGFETPEALNLAVTGRQDVSFMSKIGYTDVQLFIDQFPDAGDPATAEFALSPVQGGNEGFAWTFSVTWPMFTEFLPGEAVVRFTGMDGNTEFITTCGVLLQ